MNCFKFKSGQKGATAIEYALIVAGIGLVISGAVFLFSDQVVALFGVLEGLLG